MHALKPYLGRILRVIDLPIPSNDLLVVNYHGTPARFMASFEKQILYFSDRFHILNRQEFDSFYDKPVIASKPSLYITFDDGLKNNLHAVQLLNKFGIKASFCLIPDFIECSKADQKAFFLEYIRPTLDKTTGSLPEDSTAMGWDELHDFLEQGHGVVSHSKTHSLLSTDPADKSKLEIADSKGVIENKLETTIDTFCCPNDTLLSVGSIQFELIKQHYKYLFTTFNGSNLDRNPLFVRRINVEAYWDLSAVVYALSGLDRLRWRNRVAKFNKLQKTLI